MALFSSPYSVLSSSRWCPSPVCAAANLRADPLYISPQTWSGRPNSSLRAKTISPVLMTSATVTARYPAGTIQPAVLAGPMAEVFSSDFAYAPTPQNPALYSGRDGSKGDFYKGYPGARDVGLRRTRSPEILTSIAWSATASPATATASPRWRYKMTAVRNLVDMSLHGQPSPKAKFSPPSPTATAKWVPTATASHPRNAGPSSPTCSAFAVGGATLLLPENVAGERESAKLGLHELFPCHSPRAGRFVFGRCRKKPRQDPPFIIGVASILVLCQPGRFVHGL